MKIIKKLLQQIILSISSSFWLLFFILIGMLIFYKILENNRPILGWFIIFTLILLSLPLVFQKENISRFYVINISCIALLWVGLFIMKTLNDAPPSPSQPTIMPLPTNTTTVTPSVTITTAATLPTPAVILSTQTPTLVPIFTVTPTPALTQPASTTPSPIPITPSPAPIFHMVKKGEYLFNIASQYGVTIEAIMEANKLPNSDEIIEGQKLIIPIP